VTSSWRHPALEFFSPGVSTTGFLMSHKRAKSIFWPKNSYCISSVTRVTDVLISNEILGNKTWVAYQILPICRWTHELTVSGRYLEHDLGACWKHPSSIWKNAVSASNRPWNPNVAYQFLAGPFGARVLQFYSRNSQQQSERCKQRSHAWNWTADQKFSASQKGLLCFRLVKIVLI